jgi:hypothetical protein
MRMDGRRDPCMMRRVLWLLGSVLLLCARTCWPAPAEAGPATCEQLRESGTGRKWLSLPQSRIVLHPNVPAPAPLPEAHLPALPAHLAYHVGETPARLPYFWSWQVAAAPAGRAPATALWADFSPAEGRHWRRERLGAAFTGTSLRLLVTQPPFGSLARRITANLDATPFLFIRASHTDGQWAAKVNPGDAPVDTYVQKDTAETGSFLLDLRAATGWAGTRTFDLKLFAIGQGKSLTIEALGLVGLPQPAPPLQAENAAWAPHQLTAAAQTPARDLRIETATSFADRDTLVQVLRIREAPPATGLLLLGELPGGRSAWNPTARTLTLRGRRFHAAVAVSRAARWLGGFPSWPDWLVGRRRPDSGSGVWALSLDGVRAGEEIVVAARFAPGEGDTAAAAQAAAALAAPAAAAAAIRRQEEEWNQRLARVPLPLDFQPRLKEARGVQADAVRRAYFRSWVFLLANTLPPLPENGFPYPQVPCGKPSLWSEGAPRARASAVWESFLGMQYLAWTDPETAWAAFEGLMSLVRADGTLEGEGLPSRHAQTAWVLYSLTGEKERLNRAYPAIKRLLTWKAAEPRWLYQGSTPADLKDAEFVVHAMMDMVYARRIAQALALPDEEALWKKRLEELYQQYRTWFWERPGATPVQYFHAGAGKRDPGNVPWTLQGLALPPGVLQDAERDSLLALFRAQFNPDTAFGIPRLTKHPHFIWTLRGAWQYGRREEAALMADVAMRDVTLAGEAAESYSSGFPVRPEGVVPSVFGATLLIDAALWHNGVITGDGLPVLGRLPDAAGVTGLRVDGQPIAVRFTGTKPEVELTGKGLQRLRMLEGFVAEPLADGTPRWRGPVPETGLALQRD